MKCISLWNPWAFLIAIGKKQNETRSWPTSYRGLLAIRAAKKWNKELYDICCTEPFYSILSAECPKLKGRFAGIDIFDEVLSKTLP
jgi:hypothetical protein